jgi:hypothetical protein
VISRDAEVGGLIFDGNVRSLGAAVDREAGAFAHRAYRPLLL